MIYLERWIPAVGTALVLMVWALFLMRAERRDARARQAQSTQGSNPRA